ncbi:lambda-exonuclease family protein [Vibrio mediterranei]
MLVKNQLQQGTEAWRKWRDGGVGASDAITIMNLNPYKTRWELWAEKLGIKSRDDLSRDPNVQRGVRLEPSVRAAMEAKLGIKLDVFCGSDDQKIWRNVSFDGVTRDEESAPVEIKCPCDSYFHELAEKGLNSELIQFHKYQLQYQIAMLGAKYGYLVFYFEERNQLKVYRLNRDDTLIQEIFEAVDCFFHEHITVGRPPKKDPSRDYYDPTEEELVKWDELTLNFIAVSQEVTELKEKLKEAEADKSEVTGKLMGMAHGFKTLNLHGIRITTTKGRKTFNVSQYLEDNGIVLTDEDREKYTYYGRPSHRVSAIRNRNDLDKIDDKIVRAQREKALEVLFGNRVANEESLHDDDMLYYE